MIYKTLRAFLFLLNAERAHEFTLSALKFFLRINWIKSLVRKSNSIANPLLSRTIDGLTFPNPVGLAAGLDKNAACFDEMSSLGFGFIEIGTITPKPQGGNEKPRLFRLKKDEALLNRMGFNNEGVEMAAKRLSKKPKNVIVGGNIGKNKTTPNEDAWKDYSICFESLFPYVDYFTVNVSSPNTPDLRALQEKEPLMQLLSKLVDSNLAKTKPKPIFLKIAPDLNEMQLDDIIDIVFKTKLSGIIATNTTIDRSTLKYTREEAEAAGNGGISGVPLRDKSTRIISYLYNKSEGKIPIIGVGGIHHATDALEKIKAGATLIQLYTGFIYEGPALIKKINRAILMQ